MNPKYADYLFTELVIKAYEDKKNHNEIMHELIDRLIFCGYNLELAQSMIELEQVLIKKRNLNFKKRLYDTYWWIENYESNKLKENLFNNSLSDLFLCLSKDFYYEKKISKNILTLSEMICLEDEATYINLNIKNMPKEIKKEIDFFKSMSNEISNQYSLKDYYFRTMCSYELINKNYNHPKNLELISKRLYYNEMNILFNCKWTYKLKWQYNKKNMWKSYTQEYFERYEKKDN